MSRVWKSTMSEEYVVAAKGAPEAIAELCRLSTHQTNEVKEWASQMAGQGLRILGVAKSEVKKTASLPEHQRGLHLNFVGLVGLSDPIRKEVPATLQKCYGAGIRVAMITGDYPVTAQHIARQIGMRAADQVLTGREMEGMDDVELRRRVQSTNIFARVVPEQKLRLVNALKANGEIVAMTGDGVNDAPALKSAQIGIAMGGRGTDVAREAADLVLLDDSFSSIVEAIRLGRRIFDNLRKAMAFVLAVHVPIAGLALIPLIAKWPLVLMPVHLVFLEMIVDPACSIVFEAERGEAGLMQRPPRDVREPLFSRRLLVLSFFQGASVLVAVIGVFAIALYRGETPNNARALTFATLVVANLTLILANRSWTRIILDTPACAQCRFVVGDWRHARGARDCDLLPTVAVVVPIFRSAPVGHRNLSGSRRSEPRLVRSLEGATVQSGCPAPTVSDPNLVCAFVRCSHLTPLDLIVDFAASLKIEPLHLTSGSPSWTVADRPSRQ